MQHKQVIIELGKRIRQARDEAKLSQIQVGKAIGVTDKTISGYESARISPPVDKLVLLADMFKKPISYFLGSDPKDYKVASRLRAAEIALQEVKQILTEVRLLAQNKEIED